PGAGRAAHASRARHFPARGRDGPRPHRLRRPERGTDAGSCKAGSSDWGGAEVSGGRVSKAGAARVPTTYRPNKHSGGHAASPLSPPYDFFAGNTSGVCVTTAARRASPRVIFVCHTIVVRPLWSGVHSALATSPAGMAAKKLVLLSIVVVPAPSGKLAMV